MSRFSRSWTSRVAALGALVALGACASSSESTPPPAALPAQEHLEIRTASGAPLEAFAGDALALEVVDVHADGSTEHLPAAASVAFTAPAAITALAPDNTGPNPLPVVGTRAGTAPSAAWLANPSRLDAKNVLFILDPGTVQNGIVTVAATVSGAPHAGTVTARVIVSPAPAGDWSRGAALYGARGANCAECHGATGHGSVSTPGATKFTIAGGTYDFSASGLNAEPGNLASDSAWNAALFAVAARSDVDNRGTTLRAPMPSWLTRPNPATGRALTTQDFADIYAFLKTQIR